MGTAMGEPSGFVAAVTSLHVDGRIRERATQLLATKDSRVATQALSVRLLDHVPQVRAQAWEALGPRLGLGTAALVLDVLLAGRNRQHAGHALTDTQDALLNLTSDRELVHALIGASSRRVRRWGFTLGHERGLLSPDELIAAALRDQDQWLRTMCAEWLMALADSSRLTTLLDAKSVEARLVALTRVPDDHLSDGTLGDLMTDRAPRVREQARWRARRRGLDVASFYRHELSAADIPRVIAACLDGLALEGAEQDLPISVEFLEHDSARVRSAAVSVVVGRAGREEAVSVLTPMLLDPSARVSATAARALARLGAPPSTADSAWSSTHPASRRAAWRLTREYGGWYRVEADLRAAGDSDPQLASLGISGIVNWLHMSAATTWDRLPEEQRARISALLHASGLDGHRTRVVAFHAGIRLPPSTEPDREDDLEDGTDPSARSRRPWLRIVRRR
jgi:HEAT repeat protein